MIDVNWDLAPEGSVAVAVKIDDHEIAWVRESVEYNGWSLDEWDTNINDEWKIIATRPQQKTVADAVEKCKGLWPNKFCKGLYYDPKSDEWFCNDNPSPWYQFVCTRAEFEAYVKEQEGEEWTHVVNFGFSEQAQCKIISEHGDFLWVKVDGAGCPATYKKSELKPIKPTISKDAKRQLELYVQYRVDKYGDYAMKSDLSDYMSHHDII